MLIDFTVPKLVARELSLDLTAEAFGASIDGIPCGRPDQASNLTGRNSESDGLFPGVSTEINLFG
jgi:hypothetical protein